jgi:putative ABC transport system ATP-binding protein
MSSAIEVRSVSKIYGDGAAAVHALSEVSVDVARGEVTLLVGPSGSGKTTLLSIMGAILRPTRGSVRIAGEEIVGLRESALPRIRLQHIGFVFQGFNLFPALTVVENVALALDIRGIAARAAHRRASEMLDRVGLGDKLKSMPADLSGGQKQRVAIARALVGEPSIVLADEPTAALDSHVGRTVMDLLRSLAHDQGRAVAIVTHDNRVFDYADRIVHIQDGRLHEEPVPAPVKPTESTSVATDALPVVADSSGSHSLVVSHAYLS